MTRPLRVLIGCEESGMATAAATQWGDHALTQMEMTG